MTTSFFLIIGMAIGVIATWLVMRSKIALAETKGRCDGEVERVALAEQLKAVTQELAGTRSRLEVSETDAAGFRAQASELSQECATLSERASRLADLENQMRVSNDSAKLTAEQLAEAREMNARVAAELQAKHSGLAELESDFSSLVGEKNTLLESQSSLRATIAELETTLAQERAKDKEKLQLLNEARDVLSNQFKAVANEILDEKTKKFTEQNQTNLAQLLDPLKEKITAFQTRVDEVYVQESKDRSALGEQVKILTQLNTTLSQDAQNLTLALKGDKKAQGNWGEIILKDLLERAGLIEGQHYDSQGGVKSEDGLHHVIPDIVVHLPGDRHIVIDSKMTLPDYRAFASADCDEERAAALKRHMTSTRAHMKGLCEKEYHSHYGIKSLDFVLMFFPLEPAFMLAVTNDRELFHEAWDKNVLLVSPSTLMFVIRTVAYLWRQEVLSKNAKEISRRGAELYDKLVGFVEDLQEVGHRLDQAQKSFSEAKKKLADGKGNVIRQAEQLKDLGVKPNKNLPPQWTELASPDSVLDPLQIPLETQPQCPDESDAPSR